MADQIRVNGNLMSWGSITVKVGGARFYGFDLVSYGDKRERAYSYGQGRHHAPRGRSAGKYTPEPVKLRGPKTTMAALRKELADQSSDKKSYGNTECEIVVQFVEPGSSELPICDELQRCVYVGTSASHEESPDPLKEEVELSTMLVLRNGLSLFDGRP
jgi:hypothetical protein